MPTANPRPPSYLQFAIPAAIIIAAATVTYILLPLGSAVVLSWGYAFLLGVAALAYEISCDKYKTAVNSR